jgi:hypothetical protein
MLSLLTGTVPNFACQVSGWVNDTRSPLALFGVFPTKLATAGIICKTAKRRVKKQ